MMKLTRTVFFAILLIGAANTAWADNAYVCSIRVQTGFAKVSDTAYPHSVQVKVEARLTSEPYCQGAPAGSVTLETPLLEKSRKRKKALDYVTLSRNVWQGTLAAFQVLEIASAQGAPLNQAVTVATNVEEQPAKELAFQATRPASTTTPAKERAAAKSGSRSSGYVCLSSSKYRLRDPSEMPTVADVQSFAVSLFSKPFCRGSEVARHEYEVGPALRLSGTTPDSLFQATANMHAAALMQAINTTFVEAAMAGQFVTIEHTADGMIASVEIEARARDLAKEVQTIARPGQ